MGETVVQGRREPLRSFQFWLPESEHEQWMAFSRERERSAAAELRLTMRERMQRARGRS